MRKLIERIRVLALKDPSYPYFTEYLVEEVGELSTAIAQEKGLKQSKSLTETTEEEAIDVINVALAIILRNPKWGWDEIKDYMDKKVSRWEKRVG